MLDAPNIGWLLRSAGAVPTTVQTQGTNFKTELQLLSVTAKGNNRY
jgi:hypothetical protein